MGTAKQKPLEDPRVPFLGFTIPLTAIPKIYTICKWLCIILIACTTAAVGFAQSMLVSSIYEVRSLLIYRMVQLEENWFVKLLQYTGFNLVLAFACSFTLKVISPAGSGSGIPDVKAFLNGVEHPSFDNFFRIKTFIAKVFGSAFAVSSSLVMGKEGPMLHAGSILAVIFGRHPWLKQQMEIAAHWGVYTYNKEARDLVAIGAACGVTTAFKAPVGGVLFSMEMSTRWRKELTWRAFMACAITVVVVRLLNGACVQHNHCSMLQWGSLIWFQMTLPTPYQQVWAVAILACITGALGSVFTEFNTWVCLVRKKWAKSIWLKIAEVCAISVATSIIFFLMPVAGHCKTCDNQDEEHCIQGDVKFKSFAGYRCHAENHYNDLAVLVFNPQGFIIQALFQAHSGVFSFTSLMVYASIYWLMAAITYGAFIPSGLFTPSLIFGGCIGRMFAELLVWMGVANNTHVGMYALLGAAGFLGGLMRMSAAQALILMEMTQAPAQLPFLMLTLVLSKEVGDHFNYSVFDHQMMLKGLQFVGIDEAKARKSRMVARDVMTSNNRNRTLYEVESGPVLKNLLELHKDVDAFPVTTIPLDDETPGNFVGMIARKNISKLLDEYGETCDQIDLRTRVEVAPIIIPPKMPLPFIYRIVNAEGFNYVPVIRHYGPLEGIVSRQELVEVQNKQLDEFHLKDHIEKVEEQLEQGKLIESMNLTGNIHAAKLKQFMQNPVKATKAFLETDEARPGEEEDPDEFFVEVAEAKQQPQKQAHVAVPMPAGHDDPHQPGTKPFLSSQSAIPVTGALHGMNGRQDEAEQREAGGDSERTPLTKGYSGSS